METPSEQNVIIYFLDYLRYIPHNSFTSKDYASNSNFILYGGHIIQEVINLLKVSAIHNQFQDEKNSKNQQKYLSFMEIYDRQSMLFATYKKELDIIEDSFYEEIGFNHFWKKLTDPKSFLTHEKSMQMVQDKTQICALWLIGNKVNNEDSLPEFMILGEINDYYSNYSKHPSYEKPFANSKICENEFLHIFSIYDNNSMIAIRKIINYITSIRNELITICTDLLSHSFEGTEQPVINYSFPLDTIPPAYRIAHEAGLLKILGNGKYSPMGHSLEKLFSEWKDYLLANMVSMPNGPELARSIINPNTGNGFSIGKINAAKRKTGATKKEMDAYLDER